MSTATLLHPAAPIHPGLVPPPLSPAAPATLDQVLADVARRREEFTSLGHVPRDMVERFREAGIYRAGTPRCFGGDAMPPADFLRIVERIAAVDGSAAWVASFGSANTYLAALPRATQAFIYAEGPDQVFAGALYPPQPAVRTADGWQVTGQWKFASGCMGASWLGVGIGGGPGVKPLAAILPAARVEIVENWDVVGLEGTGSHDLRVTDQFVADDWTFQRGSGAVIDEPLYRYPATCYQAQVHAAVNIGLARAALEIVNDMSAGKVTTTGAPRMADRAYFRIELAKAQAQFEGARAYFYEAAEAVYEAIVAGQDVTPEQIGMLKLSATHAAQTAADVVRDAYRLGGMASIYSKHPLQRIVRDSMVVTQHAFLSSGNFDGAGAVLVGVPPFPGFL
ncbi:acyl-CoA dehydrogenase family protein [Pseudoduganella albidiflava]|uniref:Acyl-CoA dehydrogenase n=1 Tax=Pseudoduganella albidiflava TaxID=321983 RepID=A0A411WVH8_9BURK|nr:acyl-CoA dehydrogenase family protein [Pseudoduganella albidiflava]QBI00803.1 flavin-dependent monooxygenase [Pseudoduganella albidiflava]GGY30654.1 acyl-CoA dehydrogenase [Pseudoduganella albidiflava]